MPQIDSLKVVMFWEIKGRKCDNDPLNTFYWLLYSIGHNVKDHSDERETQLPSFHELRFPISSKGYFIWIISQTG